MSTLKVGAIQSTTGNNAITVANNGAITLPNQPTFSVIKNANQTVTVGQYIKCTWDVKSWDVGNGFDLTNSRYQPNVAGYYSTTINLRYDASTTYTRGILELYKNGSAYKRVAGHLGTNNENFNLNGTSLVYLNGTTDYIEAFVYINASVAVIGNTSPTRLCWWDGYKIG